MTLFELREAMESALPWWSMLIPLGIGAVALLVIAWMDRR